MSIINIILVVGSFTLALLSECRLAQAWSWVIQNCCSLASEAAWTHNQNKVNLITRPDLWSTEDTKNACKTLARSSELGQWAVKTFMLKYLHWQMHRLGSERQEIKTNYIDSRECGPQRLWETFFCQRIQTKAGRFCLGPWRPHGQTCWTSSPLLSDDYSTRLLLNLTIWSHRPLDSTLSISISLSTSNWTLGIQQTAANHFHQPESQTGHSPTVHAFSLWRSVNWTRYKFHTLRV